VAPRFQNARRIGFSGRALLVCPTGRLAVGDRTSVHGVRMTLAVSLESVAQLNIPMAGAGFAGTAPQVRPCLPSRGLIPHARVASRSERARPRGASGDGLAHTFPHLRLGGVGSQIPMDTPSAAARPRNVRAADGSVASLLPRA
jgi:hypothetical protein